MMVEKDMNYKNDINDLNNTAQIEIGEVIKSHRRIFGKAIILAKRIIKKSIIWFIRPIVMKQNDFNGKIVRIIEVISEKNENLENDLERTSIKVEENLKRIEEKTFKLEETNIKVEENLKRIEEKTFKLQEIEKKVLKLEKLDMRFEEFNLKLEKLKQLDSKVSNIEQTFKIELGAERVFFNKKSYSQSGEDTIIAYIFKYLAIDISKIKYLDLGANHAKELSNTNYFYENGAQGVLVEANPSLIPELHFYRHNDIILNNLVSTSGNEEIDFYVLSGDGLSTPDKEQAEETCRINPAINIEKVVKVTSITVNDIFKKYFGGIAPDFISIDIEGYDLEILKSIDLDNYRPLVIVVETIEYRPYLPINVKIDGVEKYLETKDYVEYAFTGINSIFIDAKRMKELNQDK